MSETLIEENLYSNRVMLHPDGEFMCYISEKKYNWYLKKDLAEVIDENTIQLKFEPKGKGHINDPYYSEKRENHCVVCSSTDRLTKHHVVPHQYRKHFPAEYKKHSHCDVLMVCDDCHEAYETEAQKRNEELCKRYGVDYNIIKSNMLDFSKVRGFLTTLINNRDNIPEERIQVMINEISDHFKCEVDYEILPELFERLKEERKLDSKGVYRYAPLIVEKVDMDEFILEWRRHFVDIMNPQYLSETWKKVYLNSG